MSVYSDLSQAEIVLARLGIIEQAGTIFDGVGEALAPIMLQTSSILSALIAELPVEIDPHVALLKR